MASDKIKEIKASEILDSRGNPTVQVVVTLDSGLLAKAKVPSGASTGIHEALELRDGDKDRYDGKGVLKAVANVNDIIAPLLIGHTIDDLQGLDQKMIEADGTDNKSKLGANAILGVSLAAARVGALASGQPLYKHIRDIYKLDYKGWELPTPLVNIINGGSHADSNLDWQEFWIIPYGIKDFPSALRACSEIFHALSKELSAKNYDTDVGAEGGYAPDVKSTDEVWEMILAAVKEAKYKAGKDIFLGMDTGSSEFYDNDSSKYQLSLENKSLSSDELFEYYKRWLEKYPILALEDPFDQDDWSAWQKMMSDPLVVSQGLIVIGDDLLTTNTKRLQKSIDEKAANAILIKLNQIGTLSETIAAIKMAHANGFKTAISHRSGETPDDFIADLAVAVSSEFIKTGATSRGERIAKYNRLLEIYREINDK